MALAWHPIALSNRQIKTMDRVGGAELVLPWPPGLPPGLPVERVATPREHAVAEAIVGPACAAAGLVPIRSMVRVLQRAGESEYSTGPFSVPRAGHTEQHLCVLIIGRRWVHASTRRAPATCWYAGEIEAA